MTLFTLTLTTSAQVLLDSLAPPQHSSFLKRITRHSKTLQAQKRNSYNQSTLYFDSLQTSEEKA